MIFDHNPSNGELRHVTERFPCRHRHGSHGVIRVYFRVEQLREICWHGLGILLNPRQRIPVKNMAKKDMPVLPGRASYFMVG